MMYFNIADLSHSDILNSTFPIPRMELFHVSWKSFPWPMTYGHRRIPHFGNIIQMPLAKFSMRVEGVSGLKRTLPAWKSSWIDSLFSAFSLSLTSLLLLFFRQNKDYLLYFLVISLTEAIHSLLKIVIIKKPKYQSHSKSLIRKYHTFLIWVFPVVHCDISFYGSNFNLFTAKWILQGDLDIYARTASKYDDCNLLHLPNLRLW